MLFDVPDITCDECGDPIVRALLARAPDASVSVDVGEKRVRIEGLMTEQQALEALASAGYPATVAAPHSGQGSECCGGCS